MDHIKVQCFMVLAETLNFTKAAEQIFLTQQAVSHSISSLEQELQLKLFERSTRSVCLTEEGRALYEFFSRTAGEYRALLETLQKRQHPYSMRVGYQNFISFYDKPRQALNRVTAQHPDAVVATDRFDPPALRKKLQQRELDLIVIYSRFFDGMGGGYKTLPLCEFQQYFMVSDDRQLGDDPIAELRQEPFIIDKSDSESPAEFKKRTKQELALWGFQGDALAVSDRDSAYTQAEMGRGVVVSTDLSIVSTGRALKRFNCGIPEQLIAVWREDDANPLAAQYAGALKDAFEQDK